MFSCADTSVPVLLPLVAGQRDVGPSKLDGFGACILTTAAVQASMSIFIVGPAFFFLASLSHCGGSQSLTAPVLLVMSSFRPQVHTFFLSP